MPASLPPSPPPSTPPETSPSAGFAGARGAWGAWGTWLAVGAAVLLTAAALALATGSAALGDALDVGRLFR